MIHILVPAMLAAQMSPFVYTNNGGVLTTLHGKCLKASLMGTGAAGSDLTKGGRPFRCGSAIVTLFPAKDRILIEFADSQSRAGLVGFAGTLNKAEREVKVDHLYLNDGQTLQADDGFCIIRGDAPKISSIVCEGKISQGSIAFGAMIAFETGKTAIKRRR